MGVPIAWRISMKLSGSRRSFGLTAVFQQDLAHAADRVELVGANMPVSAAGSGAHQFGMLQGAGEREVVGRFADGDARAGRSRSATLV